MITTPRVKIINNKLIIHLNIVYSIYMIIIEPPATPPKKSPCLDMTPFENIPLSLNGYISPVMDWKKEPRKWNQYKFHKV